jgi:hypothetical protein
MATELGWDAATIAAEIDGYETYLRRFEVIEELDESTAGH